MFQSREPDWDGLDRNREKPLGNPVMLQTWHDLVFLHARVPVEALQSMVPKGLVVEEFEGTGWLGFVPFRMSGVRKPGSPAVPWLGSFHETNIRTYVTHPKYGPGVWFFSLDAERFLACWYARKFFKLPYFHAIQSSQIDEVSWQYSGHRKVRQNLPKLACDVANLKDYLVSAEQSGQWHQASSRTFEYWLAERYRLYSLGSQGSLLTARVFHEPYHLSDAVVKQVVISGLESQFGLLDFHSVLLAKTLNVQCFSPERVS